MNGLSICTIALFLASFVFAQKDGNVLADQLLQKAYSLEGSNMRDSAIFYFQKAGIAYKNSEQWHWKTDIQMLRYSGAACERGNRLAILWKKKTLAVNYRCHSLFKGNEKS